MRKFKQTFILVFTILVLSMPSVAVLAQCSGNHAGSNQNRLNEPIPGITEEQLKKINDFNLTYYKNIDPIVKLQNEQKKQLTILMTSENPNMKSINKMISKISKTDEDILKEKVILVQNIRGILTFEQKLAFDSRWTLFEDETRTGCSPDAKCKK